MSDSAGPAVAITIGMIALGLFGAIGVIGQTANARNQARAEVLRSFNELESLHQRTLSECKNAKETLLNVGKIYVDYLQEIESIELRIIDANTERERLIAKRRNVEQKISESISTSKKSFAECLELVAQIESELFGYRVLVESDKVEFANMLEVEKVRLSELESMIVDLEQYQYDNSVLVDELIAAADLFLSALQQVRETEVQLRQNVENNSMRQQQIDEMELKIRGLLEEIQQDIRQIIESP